MALGEPYISKPKPAIRRSNHTSPPDIGLSSMVEDGSNRRHGSVEARAGLDAHERASRLAARVGSYSAQMSRRNSVEVNESDPATTSGEGTANDIVDDNKPKETQGEESDDDVLYQKQLRRRPTAAETEARKIVKDYQRESSYYDVEDTPLHSGQVTPAAEQRHFEAYVEPPKKYRGGILGQLLKLHGSDDLSSLEAGLGGVGSARPPHNRSTSAPMITLSEPPSPAYSPPASGTTTPTAKSSFLNLFHSGHRDKSSGALSSLVGSASTLALPQKGFAEEVSEKLKKEKRPVHKRTRSGNALASALQRLTHHEEYHITHIAETILRQKYLVKLCRALMLYGAPTHRLEEYMKYSARLLEINAQFLYIPGCMIMSFDDSSTHTAEVKLVRTNQGVDLGKLRDVHEIYKEVLHDELGVEDATRKLDDIMKKKPKHNKWFLVFMYGLASLSVGPFAFYARWIDLPMAFVLGCLLGILQLVVAPKSDLYANVFEITAAVITSFLARAIGSIPNGHGGTLFCFSALAQSSIALILPGYTVLCASLELQSRQFVAGSVRMVYAIIYSLFLGFGITIGTVIFGLMYKSATSETQCPNPMAPGWYALFVPAFTMCLVIINQAKWKQAPVMLAISCCGYVVNYWVSRFVKGNTQVANTLGAFTIGAMANLYSRVGQKVENWAMDVWELRLRPAVKRTEARLPSAHRVNSRESKEYTPRKRKLGHSLAAAAMLPAIFVQVPSGLAVSGSLVSGITSADQILSNTTGTTVVSNASDYTTINSTAFDVGYSVIQVAIGITVGLFLSALLVYPLGKKRSGLFSF